MGRTETEQTYRVVFTDGRLRPRIVEAESVSTMNRGAVITFSRGDLVIATFRAAAVERIEGTEDS